MTNREYHEHPAISKSDLDLIHRSPMHYQYRKAHPIEQTPALLIGSAVHKMVLESDGFFDEFAVLPQIDRRTKAGKEAYNAFLEASAGKSIISEEIHQLSIDIAEAVSHHKTARALLSGGKAETSHFWKDIRTGLDCKCRPDYLRSGFCVDFKTTQDASPQAFEKSAYKYRYHVQSYWYLHGLKMCGIQDIDDFAFVAVEKEPPYAVAVYYADDLMLRLGKLEAEADLERMSQCVDSGVFYGYPDSIQPLSLPAWAANQVR